MKPLPNTAREWLSTNDYPDVLRKIARVTEKWAKAGKKTRRNWWDVLAGTEDGKPITIEGVTFPVLLAARQRKNWAATPDCLRRGANETPLAIVEKGRWSK